MLDPYRKELERKSGKSVVTGENYLRQPQNRKALKKHD
jgi:hypothetical protein